MTRVALQPVWHPIEKPSSVIAKLKKEKRPTAWLKIADATAIPPVFQETWMINLQVRPRLCLWCHLEDRDLIFFTLLGLADAIFVAISA